MGHFTTITVTGLDKAHTSQPCPGNSLHTPLDPKDGAPCPVGEGVGQSILEHVGKLRSLS